MIPAERKWTEVWQKVTEACYIKKCCMKSKRMQEKVQKRNGTRKHTHLCTSLGTSATCWTNVFTNPFSNVNRFTLLQYSNSQTKKTWLIFHIYSWEMYSTLIFQIKKLHQTNVTTSLKIMFIFKCFRQTKYGIIFKKWKDIYLIKTCSFQKQMKTKNASVNCRNTLFLLFCIDAEIVLLRFE